MRPVTLLAGLDDELLHAFILAEYRDDTLDHLAPFCDKQPRPRDRLSRTEVRFAMCTRCAFIVYTGGTE